MSKREFFELSNFYLQKGGVLPSVRLAYRTIGELNAARDNAILVPSWYTGTDEDSEFYMCGPNRALNPNKILYHSHELTWKRHFIVSVQHRRSPRGR